MNATKLKILLMSAFLLTSLCLTAATVERNGVKYELDDASLTASASGVDPTMTSAVIDASVTLDGREYTVTSIAKQGFFNCRRIKSVTLPSTVRSIGSFAFLGCTLLERADIPTLADWLSIEFADGFSNPLMYARDLYVGGELLVDLTLPEGLTTVPANAFSGSSIKSVTFPSTVTEIGSHAFYQCMSLTALDAGPSVTAIGTQAFDGCEALTSATLAPAVTTIGSYAFNGCKALKNITIGKAVVTVGTDAFAGCDALEAVDIADLGSWCRIDFANEAANPLKLAHVLKLNGVTLTTLDIPDGITAIGNGTFAGCTAIETVVTGKDLTTIGDKAFNACPALKNVTFNGPVTTIGDYAFEGCPLLAANDLPATLTAIGDYAFYGTATTTATIPDGVTELPDGVFGECDRLASVTLPVGLKSIGFGCFYYCTSLTEVTLPESVAKIGKSAFNGCSALGVVRLGKGLETVSAFAFGLCRALTDIYVEAVEPPVAPENAFSTFTATLHVPPTSIDAYTADSTWGKFANIKPLENGVSDPTVDAGLRLIGRSIVFAGTDTATTVTVHTIGGQHIYSGAPTTVTLAPGTYVVRTPAQATVVSVR